MSVVQAHSFTTFRINNADYVDMSDILYFVGDYSRAK